MSDVVNLGDRRAGKSHNARDWTPVEALCELIGEIEAGRLKPDLLYVAMRVKHERGSSFPFRCAGATNIETVGLLSQHLHFRSAPD